MRISDIILYRVYPFVRDVISWLVFPAALVFGSNRNRVTVFMYHSVSPDEPERIPDYMNVTPERFKEQIRAVAEGPWRVLNADELLGFLKGELELPDGGVFITFDDGFGSFYEYAYPELVELSLWAVVFVTAAYVGTERPFPWLEHLSFGDRGSYADSWLPLNEDEINAMGGLAVGAHGYSHSRLGRMSAGETRQELRNAADSIKQLTGRNRTLFAYPHGLAYDGDWTEETNKLVAEGGFSAAFNSHFGRLRPGDDRFALKRMPVSSRDGPTAIRRKVYGAYDWTSFVQRLYHGLKRLWAKET